MPWGLGHVIEYFFNISKGAQSKKIMNKTIYKAIIGILFLAFISCKQTSTSGESKVMTKQAQESMTPDDVLKDLLKGNERYVSGELIKRNLPAQVKATTSAQYPKAVVLACIDSRVPVEYLFDQGVGDIFVARIAGNIENESLLGSMEYGVGVAGSKLIMVLGHENCGAVKSGIKKVDVGSKNVDTLLSHIEQAIQEVGGVRDANDKTYLDKVIKNNVDQTVEDIRRKSKMIRNLENEGKIKTVGAYYSLTDGKVTILENTLHENHKH